MSGSRPKGLESWMRKGKAEVVTWRCYNEGRKEMFVSGSGKFGWVG